MQVLFERNVYDYLRNELSLLVSTDFSRFVEFFFKSVFFFLRLVDLELHSFSVCQELFSEILSRRQITEQA